ncbi:YceI family protein [Streptomyces acidiscabies]|uniref:YceI family protein n=1 Tax=Streptomyces acidiscabies TaxID=42234 RepID=A0AAP6EIG2_9ACTN|nr:YceI family protein [Streptomyces acidiscabies]MBP5942102.1 YceI family protein [Streptomyces sp. LBUM 1476]MBZ3913604.1 YceI family protein [Streptomyces acidiscabies]MDX2963440.1 YceI family protein [Streptomyces acidiscabies]MDX3023174.1 YceI family protein [Streptomyces acidiscabies]MDX3792680.1 YceI family protein [Streptomyces acidiscabies]
MPTRPFVSGPRTYPAVTGAYTIDPVHSTIGFSVRRAMISTVRGRFGRFEGLLLLDGSDPSRSEAYASVQTDSVDTGVLDRDTQVAGPTFFDSATYPLMAFRSTGIFPAGGDAFRLAGSLRIKDIELPLDIDVVFGGSGDDSSGRHRVGFAGSATLRRSDWGLAWNTPLETGGVLISDKVTLSLDISAIRTDPETTA